jgi:REP-associated tyrosine transposase
MKYDPKHHHRRSIRLREYDYSSPGGYFITVCAHNKQCLFGGIVDGHMHRSQYGEIVQEEWLRSATIRKEIQLDAWVVMPNHVHGIVIITSPVGAHGDVPHDQAPRGDTSASIVTRAARAHGHALHDQAPRGDTSASTVTSPVGAHGDVPHDQAPRGNTSVSIVTSPVGAHGDVPHDQAPRGDTSASIVTSPVGAHGDAPHDQAPRGDTSASIVTSPVGARGDVPHDQAPRGDTSASIVTRAARAHGHAPLHNAPPQRRPRSLGTFVSGFKGTVKIRVNQLRGTPGAPVWQHNYYEHVVRNEDELNQIREYILNNPLRWALDRENPGRVVEADGAGAHNHTSQQEPEWY